MSVDQHQKKDKSDSTDKSSSSTSSSNSSDKQKCKVKQCSVYSPTEIYCKLHDAVVNITSQFLLTPTAAPTVPPVDSTESGTIVGNGFFVKGHFIVCPASLVLIPPTLLATHNRFPYVSATQPEPTGVAPDVITRVSLILVEVHNVNGLGHSFVYEASLIGVDGAGDLALLCIDPTKRWNLSNPCIKKSHPYFRWENSRTYKPGMKLYSYGAAIGNLGTNSGGLNNTNHRTSNIFVAGTVGNNRGADHKGISLPELVITDFAPSSGQVGMPLISEFGRVVGMITNIVQGNFRFLLEISVDSASVNTSGTSEFFLRPVIRSFLRGPESNNHLSAVVDALGTYFKYVKGYAGLAYEITSADAYSNDQTNFFKRLFFDPTTGVLAKGPACKEVIGITVLTLAGETKETGFFVPGQTASPSLPSVANSPLLGIVSPNDIITHFDKCPLGDEKGQIVPALFTWRTLPGESIKITYRKANENFETFYSAVVKLVAFPPLLDYPWANAKNLPFLLPSGPFPFPYLPAFNFHPAL